MLRGHEIQLSVEAVRFYEVLEVNYGVLLNVEGSISSMEGIYRRITVENAKGCDKV